MGLFIKEKKRPGGQPKLLGHATADTQNTDVKKNKISFESEEHKGTSFLVEIPL